MKKHIVEDLPARKFPQSSLSKSKDEKNERGSSGGESKTSEDRVSQAASDIRYRARRENIPLRQAYTQYLQNSSLSEQEKALVREKLFGKGGIVKEDYINDISQLASNSVASALYSVFVEKVNDEIDEEYLEELKKEGAERSEGERKYKVRVTDKNGVSYVRYASREKVNSLRANPNIDSVEMTEYGEPYEGERTKGERTAAVKSGKDWDGDGKKESPAKEHAGVVHNAIQRKRGGVPDGKDTSSVKEEFLGEVKKNKTSENKVYDVMRGKNTVVVSPQNSVKESAYSIFLNVLNEKTLTKAEKSKKEEIVTKLKPKYGKTSKTYAIATSVAKRVAEESDCDMKKDETEDQRSIPTKINLVKNKLRSMGLKMDYEPEGELLDERRREDKGKPRRKRDRAMEYVRSQNEKGMMTRSGKTVTQHKSERGVPERDRPKPSEETTADRLKERKRRAEVISRTSRELENDTKRT